MPVLRPTTSNPSSAAPSASKQIAESLRRRIRSGELAVGDRLPAERALAEQLDVCAATVQKALKVLEREGLVEGHRGRGRFVTNWREKRTQTIAVVLYDATHLSHPVMSQRLAGMYEPLEQAGYHIHYIAMNRRAGAAGQSWAEQVDPSIFDGAIVVANQASVRNVMDLSAHLPLVWMDHHTLGPGLLGVRSDMVGGALRAGEHLIELGHRNITLLNAGRSFEVATEQHEGVQLAARRAGGVTVRWLNVARSMDRENVYQTVRDAFSGANRGTALICGADDLLPPTVEALASLGLRVPEDISLVGWNDMLAPPDAPCPMTTVRIDFADVGRVAAQTLLRVLNNDPPDPSWLEGQVAPAELIVRASTRRLST